MTSPEALLADLQRRIREAATAAGRSPASVQLIAVSKTVELDRIRPLWEAGQQDFGENRPQELLRKQALLPQARWHLIGPLQTNKVKALIGKPYLIHSLDSVKLLHELQKRALEAHTQQPCLVQLNISDEASKGGLDEAGATELLRQAHVCPQVPIWGLMGMAAFTDDRALIRRQFQRLARALTQLQAYQAPHIQLQALSMGMSGDYREAIAEGATLVRVGSALFGARG